MIQILKNIITILNFFPNLNANINQKKIQIQ